MQDGKSGLQCCNKQRAILVSSSVSARFFSPGGIVNATHPIAKVLQSADGANAVTAIWSIVLAEMCSEVVGSKRMMFPWVLPGNMLASHPNLVGGPRGNSAFWLTKRNISISHPRSNSEMFIRGKASNLFS